jgi:hypothetical protein
MNTKTDAGRLGPLLQHKHPQVETRENHEEQ